MAGQTCYSPITGLDDTIAHYLNGGKEEGPFNKLRVAGLRALYDDAHPDAKLDETFDSVESRARALSDFFRGLRRMTRAGIVSGTKQQRKVFKGLKRRFISEEVTNRVNMITRMVMDEADNVALAHPEKSRKKIYQGFDIENIHKGGQFNFFESVYDKLLKKMVMYEMGSQDTSKSDAKRAEYKAKAEKLRKMLEPDSWTALCVKARGQLLLTEGLKLGIKEGYAEYTDGTDFEDASYIEELEDAENMTAEHWQEEVIKKSAFGSIGRKVRRYLSNVREYETTIIETESGDLKIKTSPKKDDLGFPVYLDPVEAHRKLQQLFTGISSSKDILGRLLDQNGRPREAWMAPIVADLQAHPELASDFYVDFKKDDTRYTKIVAKVMDNGVVKYFVYNLNRIKHNLYNAFTDRVKQGVQLTKWSVYNSDGTVNWNNLQRARKFIKDNLKPSEVAVTAAQQEEQPAAPVEGGTIFSRASARRRAVRRKAISKFYERSTSNDEKAAFLVEASTMFGVDLSNEEAFALLRNEKQLREYTSNLLDLVEYGVEKAALTSSNLAKLEAGTLNTSTKYSGLVSQKGSNTSMKEKLVKLMNTIADIRGISRAERMVRYKNRKDKGITLSSDTTPSYMGDRFNEIKSYVQSNDHAGLREWVEKNFLESSFFYDKSSDKILNKWLDDLYSAALDESTPLAESFAAEFIYDRNLGSDDVVFENFTSKQHAIAMLTNYFDRPKGSTIARFPVFIMGDAGASKYIKANIHNIDTLVDCMYDVYLQEKARMKQVEAFDDWLGEKAEAETGIPGYKYSSMSGNGKEVKAFMEGKDKFTYLTFLNYNHPEFGNKYSLPLNATEAQVKEKIKAFMQDQTKVFKDRLQQYGVLETVTTPDGAAAYKHLGAWVTPANIDQRIAEYYWNTKFASIEQLQMMTLDPSFYASTEDLQKRYKEIHAPGLPIDIYAIDTYSREHYGERVSDGIERAIYFDDIKINAERTNPEFMAAVENNEKVSKHYSDYVKNTLTDGQTYRSLDSYRALEIMSREWNEDKEAAYREILAIRRKGNLTAKDIDRLSKLAVSLMPKKPYLFTHEKIQLNTGETMYIPVQHKCSEAVLIPELLPEGSLLRALAVSLETPGKDGKKLDIAVSSKVVKVGAFGSTKFDNLEQYDEDIRKAKGLAPDTEVSLQDRMNYAVSLAYVHKLDYNDYRIQTNVPEHVYSSRLFGTQVRKLMMSGVIKYNQAGGIEETHFENYVGGKEVNLGGARGKVQLTGRNLVAFYNALITSNILDSYDSFEEATADRQAVSDALIQSSIASLRDSQDNIIAYGLEEDNFGLPIFDAGLEHDSSALLLSFFKKLVNKQTINGGSAVQESPFGIQDSREDGGLSYIASTADGREVRAKVVDGEVKYYDENNVEVNKKEITNIKYAEAEVPFDFKYTNADGEVVDLNYSDYCNVDGSFILGFDGVTPKIEEDFPGILDIVTYRIPSEAEYSMINVKVVRCSPRLCGGTIKVPAQGTTIAGFDFDIDKLYFMRKEFIEKPHESILSVMLSRTKKNKDREWLEYDLGKSPLEQHKDRNVAHALRNNMLLNIIRQRLMDSRTFESRYTPQGFDDSSTAARIMRDLQYTNPDEFKNPDGTINFDKLYQMAENEDTDPRPNFDPTDPNTLIVYNQQNQVASKLIGLFANQNANYAFSTLMKEFKLKSPIEFAGHFRFDGFGYDLLHSPAGRDTGRMVAEFLAASVDAVKDPTLNYLNLNTVTASAGALLARLGYNPTEIGLLFNQPIIKQACEMVFNDSIRISEAITNLKREYLGNDKDFPEVNSSNVSMDALGQSLLKARSKPNALSDKSDTVLINQQMQVLALFNKIISAASELTDFINATRFTAANSVGSTFGALYAQQYRVADYLESFKDDVKAQQMFTMTVADFSKKLVSPIENSISQLDMSKEEYLDFIMDNPFGYEQAMFDMNRKAVRHLAQFYPYETELYKKLRGRFKDLVRFSNISEDLINSIHRDIVGYLLSRQGRSLFNPKAQYPNSDKTVAEYYSSVDGGFIDTYVSKVSNNPELKEHPMIKAIELQAGAIDNETGHQAFYLNIPQSTYFKSFQKDAIKDAWEDLMRIDKQLAMDLFFYCYHKNGLNFTTFSFLHLAPTALKEAIPVPSVDNPDRTYKDFLEEIMDGKFDADLEDFAQQYIRNHSKEKSLVYDIKNEKVAKKVRAIAGVDATTGRMPSTIRIDLDSPQLKNYDRAFYTKSVEGQTRFVPAFRIDRNLYVAQSGGAHFNVSQSRVINYVRVSTLGIENVSTTYEGISGEVALGEFSPYYAPVTQESREEGPAPTAREEGDSNNNGSLIIDGFDYTEFVDAKHISRKDVINAQNNREAILNTAWNVLGEAGPYSKGAYIKDVLYNVALALGHITDKASINGLFTGLSINQIANIWSNLRDFFETSENITGEFEDKVRELFPSFQGFIGDIYRENQEQGGTGQSSEGGDDGYASRVEREQREEDEAIDRLAAAWADLYREAGKEDMTAEDIAAQVKAGLNEGSDAHSSKMDSIRILAEKLRHVCRDENTRIPMLNDQGELTYSC